jgi:DNA-binding NtrC family response regulator
VKDEMLLAMDLEALLEGWGAEVLGPVPSVEKALDVLAQDRPDAATLDMNLSGTSSLPLASELAARDIPFLVISGYSDARGEFDNFEDVRFMKKPYDQRELLRA